MDKPCFYPTSDQPLNHPEGSVLVQHGTNMSFYGGFIGMSPDLQVVISN